MVTLLRDRAHTVCVQCHARKVFAFAYFPFREFGDDNIVSLGQM